MAIPTEKTKAKIDLLRDAWVVYGAPGVGKTTLANTCPKNCLIFDFDRGTRHMDAYTVDCADVDAPYKAIDLVTNTLLQMGKEKHQYSMVAFDTTTKMMNSIEDWVVKQHGAPDINSGVLGYGKGYDKSLVKLRGIIELCKSVGLGSMLICHETQRTMTDAFGVDHKQWIPAVREKIVVDLCAEVDHVIRLERQILPNPEAATRDIKPNIEQRVILASPSTAYIAKSRGNVFKDNILCNWEAIRVSMLEAIKEKETN